MTVGELRELLEDAEDDVEVRLAHQPQWAFEYSIADGVLVSESDEDVFYLAEGSQIGYLPGEAAAAIGW